MIQKELQVTVQGQPAAAMDVGAVGSFRGPQGPQGEPGRDGMSVTHRWDGTVLTVTSASGTSSADLRGPQGPQGDPGSGGGQTTIDEDELHAMLGEVYPING